MQKAGITNEGGTKMNETYSDLYDWGPDDFDSEDYMLCDEEVGFADLSELFRHHSFHRVNGDEATF
jgi:hypothetical protein